MMVEEVASFSACMCDTRGVLYLAQPETLAAPPGRIGNSRGREYPPLKLSRETSRYSPPAKYEIFICAYAFHKSKYSYS